MNLFGFTIQSCKNMVMPAADVITTYSEDACTGKHFLTQKQAFNMDLSKQQDLQIVFELLELVL